MARPTRMMIRFHMKRETLEKKGVHVGTKQKAKKNYYYFMKRKYPSMTFVQIIRSWHKLPRQEQNKFMPVRPDGSYLLIREEVSPNQLAPKLVIQ